MPYERTSERVKQTHKYVAVARLGFAPASEYLAAQLRQARHQVARPQYVQAVHFNDLGASSVRTHDVWVRPDAGREIPPAPCETPPNVHGTALHHCAVRHAQPDDGGCSGAGLGCYGIHAGARLRTCEYCVCVLSCVVMCCVLLSLRVARNSKSLVLSLVFRAQTACRPPSQKPTAAQVPRHRGLQLAAARPPRLRRTECRGSTRIVASRARA